jgi:hypothetical protein
MLSKSALATTIRPFNTKLLLRYAPNVAKRSWHSVKKQPNWPMVIPNQPEKWSWPDQPTLATGVLFGAVATTYAYYLESMSEEREIKKLIDVISTHKGLDYGDVKLAVEKLSQLFNKGEKKPEVIISKFLYLFGQIDKAERKAFIMNLLDAHKHAGGHKDKCWALIKILGNSIFETELKNEIDEHSDYIEKTIANVDSDIGGFIYKRLSTEKSKKRIIINSLKAVRSAKESYFYEHNKKKPAFYLDMVCGSTDYIFHFDLPEEVQPQLAAYLVRDINTIIFGDRILPLKFLLSQESAVVKTLAGNRNLAIRFKKDLLQCINQAWSKERLYHSGSSILYYSLSLLFKYCTLLQVKETLLDAEKIWSDEHKAIFYNGFFKEALRHGDQLTILKLIDLLPEKHLEKYKEQFFKALSGHFAETNFDLATIKLLAEKLNINLQDKKLARILSNAAYEALDKSDDRLTERYQVYLYFKGLTGEKEEITRASGYYVE